MSKRWQKISVRPELVEGRTVRGSTGSPRTVNRIDAAFRELRRRKEKALIVYLTVGFPTVRMLPELVEACEQAGADLMELGVPFSDPLADGPTTEPRM